MYSYDLYFKSTYYDIFTHVTCTVSTYKYSCTCQSIAGSHKTLESYSYSRWSQRLGNVPLYVIVLPDSSFKDIHGRGQVFKTGISNAKFVNPSMHKKVGGFCPEIIFGISASFSSGKS
jgi:hypothetical protein